MKPAQNKPLARGVVNKHPTAEHEPFDLSCGSSASKRCARGRNIADDHAEAFLGVSYKGHTYIRNAFLF